MGQECDSAGEVGGIEAEVAPQSTTLGGVFVDISDDDSMSSARVSMRKNVATFGRCCCVVDYLRAVVYSDWGRPLPTSPPPFILLELCLASQPASQGAVRTVGRSVGALRAAAVALSVYCRGRRGFACLLSGPVVATSVSAAVWRG